MEEGVERVCVIEGRGWVDRNTEEVGDRNCSVIWSWRVRYSAGPFWIRIMACNVLIIL
jgi:hypothetical protein